MTQSNLLYFKAPVLALGSLHVATHSADSQIILGGNRFTIITPNLIRIEHAKNQEFTDAPTMFAYDRSARFPDAKITRDQDGVSIDTGVIKLVFKPDGNPLGATNLVATIYGGGKSSEWRPGDKDKLNLGGTLRTLDRVNGPVDLGQGLLSRSGWSIIDDSKTPILEDGWVKSRPDQQATDWYLFGYGHDFKAALQSLAVISGPVPLPRKNLLGLWYSRYWPYSSDDYHKIVKEYDDHGFPLDNIVMDMDWHLIEAPDVADKMIWTGYTVNAKLIPNMAELLEWFHSQGLAVMLNDHPADGVQPHEAMYSEFMQAMGADPSKKPTIPFDAGDKRYLDTFWEFTHAPLVRDGVDFWWLDWQQYPNTRSVADLSNLAWLNRYYFEQSATDGKRGVSFSRWAGWGDQRYPIEFSGDAYSDWSTLAFEVPFTSTAGNVCCFFWSHDIGGHLGGRNEESYTRWCQFGALSAALRSHSTRDATMDRRPWTYPDWAEASMKASFRLRSELMPYVYSSVAQTCSQTIPLLRPMYFAHPEQDPAYHNAQQYYFGDNLLVAPIAMPGVGPSRLGWQSVWFPEGSGPWYDYFTGERHDAGSKAIVACDINTFPLFVRAGVPLPVQPYSPRPTSAALDDLVIRCYPGQDDHIGSSILYEDDGQTEAYKSGASAKTELTYVRTGNTINVTIAPTQGHYEGQLADRSYTLELPCVEKPTAVTIDGVEQDAVYDRTTSVAQIKVPTRPIGKKTTIVVEAATVNPALVKQRAIAARLQGIVGKPIEGKSLVQLVNNAAAATPSAEVRSAVLAAAGVALVRTNDSPYLYGGHEAYAIEGPPGLLDLADATACLVSAAFPGKETPSVPIEVKLGSAIDLKSLEKLANSLPIEDAYTKPIQARLKLSIHGLPCEMIVFDSGFTGSTQLDLARQASVSASPTQDGHNAAAADVVTDCYPSRPQREWPGNHEKAIAYVTLTWPIDQSVSRVLLYDPSHPPDQVLVGRLMFSDGSSEAFGELPNAGKLPVTIKFAPKTIRWLRAEITRVETQTHNTGLPKIAAFK